MFFFYKKIIWVCVVTRFNYITLILWMFMRNRRTVLLVLVRFHMGKFKMFTDFNKLCPNFWSKCIYCVCIRLIELKTFRSQLRRSSSGGCMCQNSSVMFCLQSYMLNVLLNVPLRYRQNMLNIFILLNIRYLKRKSSLKINNCTAFTFVWVC